MFILFLLLAIIETNCITCMCPLKWYLGRKKIQFKQEPLKQSVAGFKCDE